MDNKKTLFLISLLGFCESNSVRASSQGYVGAAATEQATKERREDESGDSDGGTDDGEAGDPTRDDNRDVHTVQGPRRRES